MVTPDPARARVFGSFAADYDRYRPDYPPGALDWVLPEDAERVADVGAGTGKLTAALLDRGLHVDAVEPDAAMLEQLGRVAPGARRHRAGAEELPLADDSVDAVVVGQAWHWVDAERAVPEVRRVLRPGGTLGLLWNTVDTEAGGWVAAVEALDPDPPRGHDWRPDDVGLPDGEPELAVVAWTWWVSPDDVAGCLATHSGVAMLPDAERTALLEEAREIVRAAVDEQDRGDGMIAWPHRCLCVRWTPGA